MTRLRLTHPALGQGQPPDQIDVGFGLAGDRLRVRFEVQSTGMHVNPELDAHSPQWGLWDWDVVELFISTAASGIPYYEFQVSPIGQYFELLVREPRKDTDRSFRSGIRYGARILRDEREESRWEAWMEIPLKPLGWDGDQALIVGGVFAILGPPEARRYWSLFLPPQEKPDFHLPEHFRRLLASNT